MESQESLPPNDSLREEIFQELPEIFTGVRSELEFMLHQTTQHGTLVPRTDNSTEPQSVIQEYMERFDRQADTAQRDFRNGTSSDIFVFRKNLRHRKIVIQTEVMSKIPLSDVSAEHRFDPLGKTGREFFSQLTDQETVAMRKYVLKWGSKIYRVTHAAAKREELLSGLFVHLLSKTLPSMRKTGSHQETATAAVRTWANQNLYKPKYSGSSDVDSGSFGTSSSYDLRAGPSTTTSLGSEAGRSQTSEESMENYKPASRSLKHRPRPGKPYHRTRNDSSDGRDRSGNTSSSSSRQPVYASSSFPPRNPNQPEASSPSFTSLSPVGSGGYQGREGGSNLWYGQGPSEQPSPSSMAEASGAEHGPFTEQFSHTFHQQTNYFLPRGRLEHETLEQLRSVPYPRPYFHPSGENESSEEPGRDQHRSDPQGCSSESQLWVALPLSNMADTSHETSNRLNNSFHRSSVVRGREPSYHTQPQRMGLQQPGFSSRELPYDSRDRQGYSQTNNPYNDMSRSLMPYYSPQSFFSPGQGGNPHSVSSQTTSQVFGSSQTPHAPAFQLQQPNQPFLEASSSMNPMTTASDQQLQFSNGTTSRNTEWVGGTGTPTREWEELERLLFHEEDE